MTDTPRIAAGRFVIKFADQTATGLGADEAIKILEEKGGAAIELFVIHRVLPDGRLELAGVKPAALKTPDCLVFSRNSVAGARRDYDRLVQFAADAPPPCRIEMRFGHAKSFDPPHVVILIFPNACQEAVGAWLNNATFDPGDTVEGSRHVLEAFEAAAPQIVLTTTLDPA